MNEPIRRNVSDMIHNIAKRDAKINFALREWKLSGEYNKVCEILELQDFKNEMELYNFLRSE